MATSRRNRGAQGRTRGPDRRGRTNTTGDREELAELLRGFDPYLTARLMCRSRGIEIGGGPLTRGVHQIGLDDGARGLHWGRVASWPEELLLPQVVAVAEALEKVAVAVGVDAKRVPAMAVALQAGYRPAPRRGERHPTSPEEAVRATWTGLVELASMLKHSLAALAESAERTKQLAALTGGGNSRTPTLAILEYVGRNGALSTEALRGELRDIDLHEVPPPWDCLDRGLFCDDKTFRVTFRDPRRRPFAVSWRQIGVVARRIGILES